ncbi:MAG: hypothetical protein AAGJ38_02445 [Planctomycetota bacterium]
MQRDIAQPNPTEDPLEQEANAMLHIVEHERSHRLHNLLASQFDVLHARSVALMAFCAVVITTTGFSGRVIAGTNRLAQISIILGIAAVLSSAWFVFFKVFRIRWVSEQSLGEDAAAIASVLAERNRRQKSLRWAIYLAMIGMTFYVFAIIVMLWHPIHHALVP